MYLELELSYCFSLTDFVKYTDQMQWNHTETEMSQRLRTTGNAHLRSLNIHIGKVRSLGTGTAFYSNWIKHCTNTLWTQFRLLLYSAIIKYSHIFTWMRTRSRSISETKVLMSQSIPTGYISPPSPPGNPPEFFWSERILATRAIFCLIPYPGAKNDGRFPRGDAKFSQTRRNCSSSLEEILKNYENYETVQSFYLENLIKPLYFRLTQNHSKVFKYSSLDIQLKQWIYTHIYMVLKAIVHWRILLSFTKVWYVSNFSK